MREIRSMIPTRIRSERFGIRNSEANCKTPAVLTFQGPFPLTPALSLRERENQGPRFGNSKRLGLSNALPMRPPLPEGEGRGEGERTVDIPERCDFRNRRSSRSVLRLLNIGFRF